MLTSGSDRSSTATLAALSTGGPTSPAVVATGRRGRPPRHRPPRSRSNCTHPGAPQQARRSRAVRAGHGRPGRRGHRARPRRHHRVHRLPAAPGTHVRRTARRRRHRGSCAAPGTSTRIGILGTGNGSAVALELRRQVPRPCRPAGPRLARRRHGLDATTATEQQVAGAGGGARPRSPRACAALNCSLGADPAPRSIDAVHPRRERRDSRGSAANALLTAVVRVRSPQQRGDQQAASRPRRCGVRRRRGNHGADPGGDRAGRGGLRQRRPVHHPLHRRPAVARTRPRSRTAEAVGRAVSGCSDRTPPSDCWRAPSWPATAPPALPDELTLPVLVLSGTADPVVGNAGLAHGDRGRVERGRRDGDPDVARQRAPRHPLGLRAEVRRHLRRGRRSCPPDGSACPA